MLTGFARAFKTPDLRKKLLFTLGILAFVYTFVKSGLPVGEVDALAAAEGA